MQYLHCDEHTKLKCFINPRRPKFDFNQTKETPQNVSTEVESSAMSNYVCSWNIWIPKLTKKVTLICIKGIGRVSVYLCLYECIKRSR